MHDQNDASSVRSVVACCAATLVAYVGVVHEVVGTTLYPEGPAAFGGPLGWHAAGLAAIAAGLVLAAGALRRLAVPIVPIAGVLATIGAIVFVGDAVRGDFHLFAFTLVVACTVLVVTELRSRRAAKPRKHPSSWENLAARVNVFALHAALFRLLGGRLMGKNVLLLNTTGCRSGRSRSTPLFYVPDGGDYVVVASNGGDDHYPGWWHNIRADADVEVQVGPRVVPCHAEEVAMAETERLWPELTAVYQGYARYRVQTKRALTMFRLRPRLS